jgi:hypothetical protein
VNQFRSAGHRIRIRDYVPVFYTIFFAIGSFLPFPYVIDTKMKTSILSPENEERLTGSELARILKVASGTIRKWHAEGCPAHRLNYKLVYYRLSEVEKWLTERAAKPAVSAEQRAILTRGRTLRVVRKNNPAKALTAKGASK